MNKPNKIKYQPNAITLIALVITIIILIILAGVTLNLALGENGIFNKSKQGANKYMMESVKEELLLIIHDKELEYVKLEKELTLNELKNPTIKDVESLEIRLKKEDKNAVVYEVDEERKILPVDYKGYEFEIQGNLEVKYKGEAEKQISEKEEVQKEIEEELQKMPPEFFTTTETEGIVTITGINNVYKEENTIKYEGYTGTLVIPSTLKDGNVSTISANAMKNITNINKLYIQEGITTIDTAAFYNCSQINKLIIPDTVTKLGGNAFYQCTGLIDITLPITLNLKDGSTAAGFYNCTGIQKVTLTKGNGGEGVDYSSDSSKYLPWYYPKENEVAVKLEEGITKIGSYMFANATGIKSLNIPTTTKEIGNYAFANCSNWDEEIDISNISTMGAHAFEGCSKIKGSLNFSNEITSIPKSAFYNCSQINKLIIPDTVTELGGSIFYKCTSLTDITLPITLNISDGSKGVEFYNCTGIKEVTLTKGNGGEGVDYSSDSSKYLPWYFSRENEMIVKLEEGITKIGNFMFSGATGIKSLNIPKTTKEIGMYAFSNCSNWDEEIDISNISTMGIHAFEECSKIKGSLNFSNEITSIPKSAFYNCSQINKVTIPDTVTELGGSIFYKCTSLTDITLPITLDIGNGTKGAEFYNCTGIKEVTLTKGSGGEGASYTTDTCKQLPWYYSKENEMTIKLEEGITKIGNFMFSGATGIKSINIPTTTKEIGAYAFANCSNWDEEIDISNISTIGMHAFDGCSKINGNLNFSNEITSIPRYAFYHCEKITSINIPKTIVSIETSAFNGCTGLEKINYDGSSDDWKGIKIETGNDVLASEKINYSN